MLLMAITPAQRGYQGVLWDVINPDNFPKLQAFVRDDYASGSTERSSLWRYLAVADNVQ